MAQHAGLEVVDEDLARGAAEIVKRVLVAGQKVFERLAAGELDVHQAAVAEDHDEEGKPARGVAQQEGARASPVHLRRLARREGQGQKGGMTHRTHGADVILQNTVAAGVALLQAQALEDLLGAQSVALQPAVDGWFEGVELAAAAGCHPPGKRGYRVAVSGSSSRSRPIWLKLKPR